MPDLESEEWNEEESSSSSTAPETAEEVEDTESKDVEIVDNKPEIKHELQNMGTYSEGVGPFTVRLISTVTRTEAYFRCSVTKDGTQGPIASFRHRIDDDAAAALGMSEELQSRINKILAYAEENVEIPRALRGQVHEKRSLSDLEDGFGIDA